MHRENLVPVPSQELYDALQQSGMDVVSTEQIVRQFRIQESKDLRCFLLERVSESVYIWIKSKEGSIQEARSVDDCIALVGQYVENYSRRK